MKLPSAPIYPVLSTEYGQYERLQKISEIEKKSIGERDAKKHYKKSKRRFNIPDGVDTTLIDAGVNLARVGIAISIMPPHVKGTETL